MLEEFNLIAFLDSLLNALLYPFYSVLHMIWGWIVIIISAITGLYNAIMGLFSILVSFITSVSDIMFPGQWGTFIVIGLTIVFALRVYYFLKDVSIGGFKL